MRFVCCMTLASVIAVGARSSAGTQSKTAATGAVLGVEELMRATTHPSGTVRVAGVVSAVSPKEKRLALIDLRELDECGKTTCAEFTLPVEWTGTMPAVRDVVRVVGQVKEVHGKLIFVARTLEHTTAAAEKGLQ